MIEHHIIWKMITLQSLWVDRSLFQIWWSGRDPGLIESHDLNHDQKKTQNMGFSTSSGTKTINISYMYGMYFSDLAAPVSVTHWYIDAHRMFFVSSSRLWEKRDRYGLEERFETIKNLHLMVMFGHIVQWYVWNLHIQNPHCRLVCVWNVPCLLLK